MKKKYVQFISCVLSIVLLFSAVSMSVAVADFEDEGLIQTCLLSNSGKFIKRLSLVDNELIISGIPDDQKFNYFWIELTNGSGDQLVRRIVANQDGTVRCNLGENTNGTYYIDIFTNSYESGTFKGLFWGEDITVIKRENYYFKTPGQYSYNQFVQSTKRSDETALNYYLQPSYGIESDSSEIIILAETLTAGISNDYDKAFALYEYVADNIYYDYDSLYNRAGVTKSYTALETLHSKRSVCQGYASLLTALLRACEIPAKLVRGYALGQTSSGSFDNIPITESNHAWTEFYADGRWITVDVTWDSGNKWENGSISCSDGLRNCKYFDPNLFSFSINHRLVDYSEQRIPDNEDGNDNPSVIPENPDNSDYGEQTDESDDSFFSKVMNIIESFIVFCIRIITFIMNLFK